MECIKCKSEMRYSRDGISAVWTCPECGYALATTYSNPMELDFEKYNLTIKKVEQPKAVQIKCVSEICKCGLLEAKESLQNDLVVSDKNAKEVAEYIKKLSLVELEYSVTPDFPYEL